MEYTRELFMEKSKKKKKKKKKFKKSRTNAELAFSHNIK